MREIVLMSDARVAAVRVRGCAEQLVDVRGFLLVDDRKHADSHGAEYTGTLRAEHPDWPAERIRAAAGR
jgi:hypothetical protein